MKSNISESEIIDLFEQYINGNIKDSINEYANLCSEDKATTLVFISEMWGADKAIHFMHKYLLSCE